MSLSSPALAPDDAALAARLVLVDLLADAPHLVLPPAALDGLQHYVALLLDANARLNLTRVTEPDEVARLHLLDALAALPLLDSLASPRAIDLGSGGGLPAIPLAIARPQVRWTLIESVGKKAAALRSIVAELGLGNVEVLAERAEVAGQDPRLRECFDLATARACATLPVLAELALPLLRRGGTLIAWKGPLVDADAEVRGGRIAIGQLGGGKLRIVVSGVAALGGHRFVVVPKVAPTPPRFPRRPGEPRRRPLG
jgi:16S rRNA (guanine(527)-N(7))-methyltransferase GidB